MMPSSVPPVVARRTFTDSAPAALSAAASACAVGRPPVTTATVRPSAARASPATNSEPRPRSMPSDSQITSMPGVAASRRAIVGSASVRSTACGFGLSCLSRTRAAAGGCNEISRRGFAERHDGDAAVVGLGAGDDVVGGADPGVPACRGAKAVVDQERDRGRSGGGRAAALRVDPPRRATAPSRSAKEARLDAKRRQARRKQQRRRPSGDD